MVAYEYIDKAFLMIFWLFRKHNFIAICFKKSLKYRQGSVNFSFMSHCVRIFNTFQDLSIETLNREKVMNKDYIKLFNCLALSHNIIHFRKRIPQIRKTPLGKCCSLIRQRTLFIAVKGVIIHMSISINRNLCHKYEMKVVEAMAY